MSTPRTLLIAGPLPPPKGGVSVHIDRLMALVRGAGFAVELIDESPVRKPNVFNVRGLNVFRYLGRFLRSDIVHVHSSVDVFRLSHVVTAWLLRRPVVITLHSWRPRGWLSRRLHRWAFRRALRVIAVSQRIADEILAELTSEQQALSDWIAVRPAFIPPHLDRESALPAHLGDWITQQRLAERHIIASNAYQLDQFEDNDIYGTDLCISMMHTLVYQQRMPVALIFNVASLAKGKDTFSKYQRLIKELKLEQHVLLINEPDLSFVRLLDETDLSVRATNTDGDALSIREALFLAKPVIASDVAVRPEGTHIFQNRNVTSFVSTTQKVVDALMRGDTAPALDTDDSEQFYLQLYTLA